MEPRAPTGSLTINVGSNLLKLAHDDKARKGHTALWALGFALFGLGNLANLTAFAYAPASLLSAVQAVQYLSNVACSRLMHGEKVEANVRCMQACTAEPVG